ncbi:hypothetical protein ABT214_04455 [Micromonospora purpureochromogenes]|uniref:hypothetical protein n=1 Tax=Micromonospora purpureochromogenes TaxID=47872 RepID=UPI003316BED9
MALLFFLVVFALLAAIEAAPRISRWLHRLARSDGSLARAFQLDPGVARVASRALTDVERAEAALVALLLAGDLPAAQYQRDMAALAVRDALRNPLVVPPERRF